MVTPMDVMEASVEELLRDPERFADVPVELQGTLHNRGTDYFRDLRPMLLSQEGAEIAVTPWLPLEVPVPRPGSNPPRPALMSDFLGRDVVLEGTLQGRQGAFALHVDRAEVVHPSIHLLSREQLRTIADVGGAGMYGSGVLPGELTARQKRAALVTANKGTRSEVSFTTDLTERVVRPIEGKPVWIAGVIRKTTPWTGIIHRARLIHWPESQRLPRDHVTLEGKIEERRPAGAEAPPAGSWLVLRAPIAVGRAEVREVHVQKAGGVHGAKVRLHGRLEARHSGGMETPQVPYFALSEVSNLGAGEPLFDGMQFLGAETGAHLRVVILERREMFDAPNVILVLDPTARRAFLGSAGGRTLAGENTFHGFSGSAMITEPDAADRSAVSFDEQGAATSMATGAPLLEVAREHLQDGEGREPITTALYFDVGTYRVYAFSSAPSTGRHLTSVIHVPHAG